MTARPLSPLHPMAGIGFILVALTTGCVPFWDQEYVDADGDGFPAVVVEGSIYLRGRTGDCNDNDGEAYPGGIEVPCDGVDQDCSGEDDGVEDGDNDGALACIDGAHSLSEVYGDGDCDDDDGTAYPGAEEACDGIDNDCDGDLGPDEHDADDDGFTPCGVGGVEPDCDDHDAERYPGAPALCRDLDDYESMDDVDYDCSGRKDFSEGRVEMVYNGEELVDALNNLGSGGTRWAYVETVCADPWGDFSIVSDDLPLTIEVPVRLDGGGITIQPDDNDNDVPIFKIEANTTPSNQRVTNAG